MRFYATISSKPLTWTMTSSIAGAQVVYHFVL